MMNRHSGKKLSEKDIQIEDIKKDMESFDRRLTKEEKIMYIHMFKQAGCTYKEIGAILGCTAQRISSLINEEELTQAERDNIRLRETFKKDKKAREQLIWNLRKLYEQNEELYNMTSYKEHAACFKYFGSWENALAEAGIVIKKLESIGDLSYTEEQLEKYAEYLRKINHGDQGARQRAEVSLRIWANSEGFSDKKLENMRNHIPAEKLYDKKASSTYGSLYFDLLDDIMYLDRARPKQDNYSRNSLIDPLDDYWGLWKK